MNKETNFKMYHKICFILLLTHNIDSEIDCKPYY